MNLPTKKPGASRAFSLLQNPYPAEVLPYSVTEKYIKPILAILQIQHAGPNRPTLTGEACCLNPTSKTSAGITSEPEKKNKKPPSGGFFVDCEG